MVVIISAYIAYTLVGLASTSSHGNLQSSEEDTFTYCDPEYYTTNITAYYAGNECAWKCSFLHGYINSENELVCYKDKFQAKRISRIIDRVAKGECVCGRKASDQDNRQNCYPPFKLITNQCDKECSEYTLLRGKKLTENSISVMWCGKEWNEDNYIDKLDYMVKEVGQTQKNLFSNASVRTIYGCFCGSKSRKARTFISADTFRKMELRKISQNAEGRDLDKFGATCSFGKFWIKRKSKFKCQSICTTKKAFMLPNSRELICYTDKMPASRINPFHENHCLCGAMFGKGLLNLHACIPTIKEENARRVDLETFRNDCKQTCQHHDAYIASNTEFCRLVFCESRIKPFSKIIFDYKLEYKLGQISNADNNMIECECGLTELTLMKYKYQKSNEVASQSHSDINNLNSSNIADYPNLGANTLQGMVVNDGKSTGQNETPSFRMNQSGGLSHATNRVGIIYQVGSSSQAASSRPNLIASSHPTLNRDGRTSHIAILSQRGHQTQIGSLIPTSTQAANDNAESFQKGSSGGMTNQIASHLSQSTIRGGNANQVTNPPQVGSINERSHQTKSSNRTSSKIENCVGVANPRSTSQRAVSRSGISQKGSSDRNANSTDRLDSNGNEKSSTFNRDSRSSKKTNPIENTKEIAQLSPVSNRRKAGNLSAGSSREINHGASSSGKLNYSDNYIFGDILKNTSFLDKPRRVYQGLVENELLRNSLSDNNREDRGLDIIASTNYRRKKASSVSSQVSSASMTDTATSKYKNHEEDEIFGDILNDVPFLNSMGHQGPATIDAIRGYSPVADYSLSSPNCNHKRKHDELPLEAIFSLPDFVDFGSFPEQHIIPFKYGSEGCSSYYANHTASSHGKRVRN